MSEKRRWITFFALILFLIIFIYFVQLFQNSSSPPYTQPRTPTESSTPTKSDDSSKGNSGNSGGSNDTPKGGGHTPITICHAVDSELNPYIKTFVDDDGTYGGHIYHDDDIIPAPAGGCSMADRGVANDNEVAIDEVTRIDEIVDTQLKNSMKSNIVFDRPESVKVGETTVIELRLNPSLSFNALATEMAESIYFVTSTAEPGHLVGQAGEDVTVETVNIEITNRMKATLTSLDPEAFDVKELHDSAEQAISAVDTTVWRWAITAKTEGTKTFILTLFRLIITSNGSEYWREVETYKTSIVVEFVKKPFIEQIKSWDWQWIIGIFVSVLSLPLFWGWYDRRKKGSIVIEGDVTGSSISTGDDPVSIIGDGNKVSRVEKDHD